MDLQEGWAVLNQHSGDTKAQWVSPSGWSLAWSQPPTSYLWGWVVVLATFSQGFFPRWGLWWIYPENFRNDFKRKIR